MFQDPDSSPGDHIDRPTEPAPVRQESCIPSSDLLKGRREVLIQHGGETYRLRVTKNGKLILHK